MFNIFRKFTPRLIEMIPKNFVDIHSHILPGVDDGPKKIDQSIELISEMKKMGFSKIIGTPHTYPGLYNNTNNSIKKSLNQVRNNIKIKIELSCASEYMVDESLIHKAENNNLLCLSDNFVLIETSINYTPLIFDDVIFNLQTNGYNPVIAHPERYTYMYKEKEKIFSLADKGCKFQINLLSIVGYYGKNSIIFCDFLLKNNLVDFVGSDIHNLGQLTYFNNPIKIKENRKITKIFENTKKQFS